MKINVKCINQRTQLFSVSNTGYSHHYYFRDSLGVNTFLMNKLINY